MVSKKIVYSLILTGLLIVFGGIIAFNHSKPKAIETLNAHVVADYADIITTDSGKISNILITQSQDIRKGDVIAELSVSSVVRKNSKNTKSVNKKEVEQDFETAAIMYKDGVISQDEYDKSVENLEEKMNSTPEGKSENITTSRIVKIYSPIDGKIVWGSLKIGDNVGKDVVIAKVNSSYKEVLAHFSTTNSDKISVGDRANIKLIKYPEKHFTGVVNSIGVPDKKGVPIVLTFEDETSNIDILNGDSAIVRLDTHK